MRYYGQKRMGYVYLNGIVDDGDDLCMAPIILRSGEEICDDIMYYIANDTLQSIGVRNKYFCFSTLKERDAIRTTLASYAEKLPDYRHLLDELFHDGL